MSKCCYGVDIGGTTVKIGLFTPDGDMTEKWEIPTNTENNGRQILTDIALSIEENLTKNGTAKSDVIGIGLGVPGPVDTEGVVHKAANLGWGEFNLENELENIIGISVKGGNDANVAALGEMWKGGGKGYKDLVVVTLGTGVGGGVITNGRIVFGYLGAGGEIGHINIDPNESETCGCGNRGCLEQYASATGIVRLAGRKLNSTNAASVLRNDQISAKSVFDAVKAGDAVAIEIAEEFGEYLGRGLANVAAVTNPEIFVIGGGVSKAGEIILDYIREPYRKYAFHASREAGFALATLGNDAGMYGAVKLVLDN